MAWMMKGNVAQREKICFIFGHFASYLLMLGAAALGSGWTGLGGDPAATQQKCGQPFAGIWCYDNKLKVDGCQARSSHMRAQSKRAADTTKQISRSQPTKAAAKTSKNNKQ